MMTRAFVLRFLLLSGFLLGQWMAVVHAAGHEILEPGSVHCHVCSIAHAAPVASALPSLARMTVRHELAPVASFVAPTLRPLDDPRSRGPPA